MDGNKNAMYAQAGRNRGWSQSGMDKAATEKPAMPAVPVNPAPAAPRTIPMISEIPAPPKVILPEIRGAAKSVDACETPVMAFVPWQKWRELYEPEQGFSRGTLFKELDLPFVGEGACQNE